MWATIFSCCLGKKRKKKKKRILESNCKVVWLPRCVCVLRSPRHPYGFSTSYSVISAWVLKTKEFIWATIKIKVETIVKKKKLKDNLRFVRKRAVSYGSTLKKKRSKINFIHKGQKFLFNLMNSLWEKCLQNSFLPNWSTLSDPGV